MNFELYKVIDSESSRYKWVIRDNLNKYDRLLDDVTKFVDPERGTRRRNGLFTDEYKLVAEFNNLEDLPNLLPEEFI